MDEVLALFGNNGFNPVYITYLKSFTKMKRNLTILSTSLILLLGFT